MFEQIWLLVFLVSLCASLLITWRTHVKGKQISFPLVGLATVVTLGRTFAFFVIVCLPLIDQPRISNTIVLPIIGWILVVFGIFLIAVATKELSKTEFRGGKGIPAKIIMTGPYSIIRHPANVGFISSFGGWSLVWGAIYGFCLLPILTVGLIIEAFWEERNLEKTLGDEYRNYKRKVGMFFPKIIRRQKMNTL